MILLLNKKNPGALNPGFLGGKKTLLKQRHLHSLGEFACFHCVEIYTC